MLCGLRSQDFRVVSLLLECFGLRGVSVQVRMAWSTRNVVLSMKGSLGLRGQDELVRLLSDIIRDPSSPTFVLCIPQGAP